jgi:arabinogalactan oligomer/maltooligosaccharide transport system permease protein
MINVVIYCILSLLSLIWLIPIFWVVLTSLRQESGAFVPYFLPRQITFDNYIRLFTDTRLFSFPRWFANTFFVAVCACILTTLLNLSTAYVISRLRFTFRKTYMNVALVLNMFPGFMSMIAVYYILKAIGMTQSLLALILVYSAGAGLSFYIAKGFFDTIPKELDEAARIDGASNAKVFSKIILPLSKPIIVYTALTAFIAPWVDFIFAKILMGDNYEKYTVAIGLFTMLTKENIDRNFTLFAAGSVCIAIPITLLFIYLQKYFVAGVTGGAVKG